MNSFGRIFRVHIWGESHGPAIGVTIDGCPPGIQLTAACFEADMQRRQGGQQKGTTPRKEDDIPSFLSGIFKDHSTGAPITILLENNNTRSSDYEKARSIPRPGHADFVAHQKFNGFEDFRGGGHFSGRLTACIVAAGVVARKVLAGVHIEARLIELGGLTDIEAGLQRGIAAKDSVGGIVECRVNGLPAGLGEPFWDSAESLLAHAMFSIPAVRGIEFGTGFKAAGMFGSTHNDALTDNDGHTASNHAGGIVGGITNNNELLFRIAVKPASSTPKEQTSLNWETGEQETFAIRGRHDLAIALRVPVVVEAMTAIVLTDLLMIRNSSQTLPAQ